MPLPIRDAYDRLPPGDDGCDAPTARGAARAHNAGDDEAAFKASTLHVAMRRDWLLRNFWDAATMRKRGENCPPLVLDHAVTR